MKKSIVALFVLLFGSLIITSVAFSAELKSGEFTIQKLEEITAGETVETVTSTATVEEEVTVRRPYQHVGLLQIRSDR